MIQEISLHAVCGKASFRCCSSSVFLITDLRLHYCYELHLQRQRTVSKLKLKRSSSCQMITILVMEQMTKSPLVNHRMNFHVLPTWHKVLMWRRYWLVRMWSQADLPLLPTDILAPVEARMKVRWGKAPLAKYHNWIITVWSQTHMPLL